MTNRSDRELLNAVARGDERAFERLYELFSRPARLAAWRVSHRPDWVDDILSESWCRAFDQRTTYNPKYPFLVWLAGIIRNVYREFCRKSPLTLAPDELGGSVGPDDVDELEPEAIAHQTEVLLALNDCVSRLSASEAEIVRRRFFAGETLRAVSEGVNVPEATLRTKIIPTLLDRLRRCMRRKNIEFSEFLPAQGAGETQ